MTTPISILQKYSIHLEVTCLAAFAGAFLFRSTYSYSEEIIIISLSALSGIYFLMTYVPRASQNEEGQNDDNQKGMLGLLGSTIAPKIISIGSSVTVIGILFAIEQWNGFREMILIGSSSLTGAVVVLLSSFGNESLRVKFIPLLYRAVPLLAIGFYLLKIYGISTPR
ncbi:MAG: hypothetical protein JSS79_01005 [Bacteroidetes bacterium]|nr:hypothetical protein [Bacteroidota bacterium]